MFKQKNTSIIIFFCVINLALHLTGDLNSGLVGDELLHIETGNHISFGYMEFPPMIGWLAFIQNQFHSQSVFVHHFFTHLASILLIILVGLTIIELGGKTISLFIGLLCIVIVAPGLVKTQQLFQPVVFSQLFWVLAFYQLVRFIKTLNNKYLLYLTISLGFGFLVKYDILFFMTGLSGLLLFKRTRTAILTKSIWKYFLLFFFIICPNIWWQFEHQFPVLSMISRLYQTQLDHLTVVRVIVELVVALNPFAAFLWIGGIFFMFNKNDKIINRPAAVSIVLSVFFLAICRSKAYYFFSAMITLLIFGSIWFEQKIFAKQKWVIYPVIVLMTLTGLILLPHAISVMPLNSFLKYALIKKKDNHFILNQDYQEFYSQSKWQNTLGALKQVYDSLPQTEKQYCLIWGKHYEQAGVVSMYGKDYGLPKAFSYNGSFYLWAPQGPMPGVIIAFTEDQNQVNFFQDFFSTVIPVKKVFNSYAESDKYLWQTIYVCKNPKQTFADLNKYFKARVFN
jgi:hypothetical protein